MGRFDYKRYLASREWAVLKEQLRERAGGKCERCEQRPYEETHHLTYERIGHEDLKDLLAVCAPCHRFLSAKTEVDPRSSLSGPIRFIAPWSSEYVGSGDTQQLCCPVCGYNYVHFGSPSETVGDDYLCGWVRGDVIHVPFWCENGHRWTLEIGFHKGHSFMRYAPEWTTDAEAGEAEFFQRPQDGETPAWFKTVFVP